MADTITLPGTGMVVATDEIVVSAVTQHAQRVKLVDGTDGGNALIPGTAANGLLADVSRVQGTVMVQGVQAVRQTANITTATSVVGPFTATAYNIATVTISGTYAGVTAVFEGSDDGGTTWFTVQGSRTDSGLLETGPSLLTNTARAWDVALGGFSNFRVRATAWTSGTAVVGVNLQTMPYEPAPSIAAMPKGLTITPIVVSVGGTATLILAANPARKAAIFINNGSQSVFMSGANTVTVANAPPVYAGATLVDGDSVAAWYGIVASGTCDVRGWEIS